MMRRMRDVNGTVLHADVVVVGAGFAGIDVATQLGRRGLRVVLLESGGVSFDARTQALTAIEQPPSSSTKRIRVPDPHGPFTPYLASKYRGHTRLRQLGGTSGIWTGKWRMFDAIDFVERSWIPHSGWPLSLDELRPCYDEVARDLRLASFATLASSSDLIRVRTAVRASGLATSFHWWAKRPLRLARAFLPELTPSKHITVVLGANVTTLQYARPREHVTSIACRSLRGEACSVEAERVVLASGGIEVPRLLLASGIGSDLVGRFYMDHPKKKRIRLRTTHAEANRIDEVFGELARTAPRPRAHVSFALDDDTQRAHSLPNHALYVGRDDPEGEGEGESQSVIALYVEQVPNPASRIRLASTRDELGMPRAEVDWRLHDIDIGAYPVLLRELARAWHRAGFGTLDVDSITIDDTVDAAHHMGTTRMARDATDGVVDVNCRVFGTDNLYVASSAVFPTGHSAAPTFTILALARRLAHHLAAS